MMNLARARAIVSALPVGDSIKSAQQAARWLVSINDTKGYTFAARYELIDMIDASLQPHGQALLQQYLALKSRSKFQEAQLWKAATDFWKALGDAYLTCIARVKSDQAAATFLEVQPVLTAHAMRAQSMQIKWILMRYGYVNDTYWYSVARLYRAAQSGGFLDQSVDGYDGAPVRDTVRQAFLRIMMLCVSSTSALTPAQQDIAERVIAHFSEAFVLGMQSDEQYNFVFDLNGGRPPARVPANVPYGATCIYFAAGGALAGVQKIVDAINDAGSPDPDMNLGSEADGDQIIHMLLHLAFNWDKELPARDSERRPVNTILRVTEGFDGIMSQGFGRGVSEVWTVENASDEAYGVLVPDRHSEWLQVGLLIGIRAEGADAAWGAGVVRRVETDTHGHRHAGIQVISRAVTCGTMCTLSTEGARGSPHYVILLDAEPSPSGYLQALVRPGMFSLDEPLEATCTADGRKFHVAPSGMIEAGPDFDRARFKVVG